MLPEDLCCHTLLACEMRLHSAPTRVERDVLRCAVSSVRHDDVALMPTGQRRIRGAANAFLIH
jgi:hypothetical protein